MKKEDRMKETRRKGRLRKTVEENRQSMKKMTPKKQLETCCICLEDIQLDCEAILDACPHKYCHPCIKQWVQDMENSCLQCKKKIYKISYRDILGRMQSQEILDKVQEVDNFEDMYCEGCRLRIYERNFDGRNPD